MQARECSIDYCISAGGKYPQLWAFYNDVIYKARECNVVTYIKKKNNDLLDQPH